MDIGSGSLFLSHAHFEMDIADRFPDQRNPHLYSGRRLLRYESRLPRAVANVMELPQRERS
jgi:hypothetical protein